MPDSGPLPLVLYSHQQVLDKLAVLKDNVLYCEPITAELEVPKKKPKSGQRRKHVHRQPENTEVLHLLISTLNLDKNIVISEKVFIASTMKLRKT